MLQKECQKEMSHCSNNLMLQNVRQKEMSQCHFTKETSKRNEIAFTSSYNMVAIFHLLIAMSTYTGKVWTSIDRL